MRNTHLINILNVLSGDSGSNYQTRNYEYDVDGYPSIETYYKGGKEVTTITKYQY